MGSFHNNKNACVALIVWDVLEVYIGVKISMSQKIWDLYPQISAKLLERVLVYPIFQNSILTRMKEPQTLGFITRKTFSDDIFLGIALIYGSNIVDLVTFSTSYTKHLVEGIKPIGLKSGAIFSVSCRKHNNKSTRMVYWHDLTIFAHFVRVTGSSKY